MKRSLLFVSILLCGMVCLMGCGGGDSDDSSSSAAAPAAPSSSGSSSGSAPAVTNAPAAPDADAVFAATSPTSLKMSNKFTIAGRGIVYEVVCDAISGATTYTFTISYGDTQTAVSPTTAFLNTGPDNVFTVTVYATNANGIQSKSASTEINN